MQRLLPPWERAARLERRFKAAIVALTALAVIGVVAGTQAGRHGSSLAARRLKWGVQSLLGMNPSRAEIAADFGVRRMRGIEQTRATYRAYFEQDASAGLRGILGAARMEPDDVLLRWANGDWTIVFSPLVFQADDRGRAYRMRPGIRSFWLSDHVMTRGLISFFFLPDTAEVRAAVTASDAAIMSESYQTTNSWGCRGPEPDPGARRVLVLGDSFMQGLFVPDDQTPPEHLRRHLESAWGQGVSVLNTGHIGYSPEQYYYTLREYYDRFRPEFVVVSVCPNDFGDVRSVLSGRGDRSEAAYWLDEIHQFCRTRLTPCLLAAAPLEVMVMHNRSDTHYPGDVLNLWDGSSGTFLDLTEPFIDEHMRLAAEAIRRGRRPQTSLLFNGHLHDAHFSPQGAATWGQAVGRRLERLLDYQQAPRKK